MKKKLAIFLSLVLSLSLVACNSNTSSNTGTTGTTDTTQTTDGGESGRKLATDYSTTLSYVSWNSTQEKQNMATIEAFNEIYPNIKIELSYSTWSEYWNKLEAAASAGNLSNLVTQHTNCIEMYVNNGFVEDLGNIAEYDAAFSYDNHPEDVKKLYRFDDTMWGIPKDFDCIVLVYNKKMFDDAGLEYPTDDWTWDDLETAAAALTDKANNKYGFAARNDQQGGYASFLYQNGGGLLTDDASSSLVDSPETIEAFKWWMYMYDNYSPTQAMLTESSADAIFAADQLAMTTDGNWALDAYYDNEEIADKFDIVALPSPANGKKATVMNGLALTVTSEAGGSTAEQIEAAKQFAAFFGTYEGQSVAAMGPSIPCYEGVSDEWAELNKDLFNVDAVLSQMEYGVQWIGTELKTQWNSALETRIGNIYSGADIETELKAAAEEMNEILQKQN